VSICRQIKKAVLLGGVIRVPHGVRTVQIQSWAHTIAERLRIEVKTRTYRSDGAIFVKFLPLTAQEAQIKAHRRAMKRLRREELVPVSWAWRTPA
jgi:hypothetical protein